MLRSPAVSRVSTSGSTQASHSRHEETIAKLASTHGHTHILDYWRKLRGEKMLFDNQVLVGPTKMGHADVLEWWKRCGLRVEYKTCDIEEALEDGVEGRCWREREEMVGVEWIEPWGWNERVDESESVGLLKGFDTEMVLTSSCQHTGIILISILVTGYTCRRLFFLFEDIDLLKISVLFAT